MIAASRVLALTRTVIPYATYVVMAVQLGYGCFSAYEWYQRWCQQYESDTRNGVSRTPRETMEYIVRPRRRNNTSNTTSQNVPQPQSWEESQRILYADLSVDGSEEDSDSIQPTQENSSPIVQDTRCDEMLARQLSLTDQFSETAQSERDETSTIASTSLESTDSNRGIVTDMYTQCFICAEPLDDATRQVATLPMCMHPFHKTCLDGVLRWHRKCPICNVHIFSPI